MILIKGLNEKLRESEAQQSTFFTGIIPIILRQHPVEDPEQLTTSGQKRRKQDKVHLKATRAEVLIQLKRQFWRGFSSNDDMHFEIDDTQCFPSVILLTPRTYQEHQIFGHLHLV